MCERDASPPSGWLATVVAASFFASGMTTWAMRGQTTREASQLTGRTKVWSEILAADRPHVEELFGSGLSNQSFNGLPIDSTWLGVYVDQGVVGVVLLATMVLVLLIMAATHERGPRRAVALFLVTYCVVASITETGPRSRHAVPARSGRRCCAARAQHVEESNERQSGRGRSRR